MSLLVVGLSHRTAPLPLLERVALDGEDGSRSLLDRLLAADHVAEAVVAVAPATGSRSTPTSASSTAASTDVTTVLAEATGDAA